MICEPKLLFSLPTYLIPMLCTYIYLGQNHGTQWGEILPAVLCFVTKFKIILKLQFRDLRKCLVNFLLVVTLSIYQIAPS